MKKEITQEQLQKRKKANKIIIISFFIIVIFLMLIGKKNQSVKDDYKLSKDKTIINYDSLRQNDIKDSIEFSKWEKTTKAGKIHLKHPDWSKEDCELISKKRLWIGMDIKMVYYMRGAANKRNVSNYGNGSEYQYCWDDYNPSYFYCGEDGIVIAYN